METIQNKCSSLLAGVQARIGRSELGQGALEYIAIVVGLIILIAIGFAIAGKDIGACAESFIDNIFNSIESESNSAEC